ncbi:glycosyl hydrolase family protein [Actinidia rufa]|uniref:Glycosyl hydrolase family protein n=1 Tax=Actinidia rufa TaxID=165716 RepID=A0A7J0FCU8_9ERIC|nr:glycosyl hydrolase family protein [Actinidia rufa]
MDVNCGSYLKNYTKSAVEQKKLSISDIHRALHNLFSVRMRLGLFNGNPRNLLFGNIGANQVCTKEHQDLALEAARPHANVPHTLLGNYEGPPCKKISPLQALQGYVRDTMYHRNAVNCSTADVEKAVEVAKKADYVVLVMGLDEYQDRDDLLLPAMQQSLIQRVARAAKRPVVLVLLCRGPVDVSFPKGNPKIGGILWVGYPGESGGIALAEIIFGEYNLGENLSHCWVKNDGEMDGKHPVLLFVRQEGARKGSPVKQLIGFHSVGLKAGERAEFGFELNPCEHFSRANEDGLMVIEEGTRSLLVWGREVSD